MRAVSQLYLTEVSTYNFKILKYFLFWSRSFSESIANQESDFLVSANFCPSMQGSTFPVCSISCWRESAPLGNYWGDIGVIRKGRREKLGTCYLKSRCYQDIDIGNHLKRYIIIKGLVTNFHYLKKRCLGISGPDTLGRIVSSEIVKSGSSRRGAVVNESD